MSASYSLSADRVTRKIVRPMPEGTAIITLYCERPGGFTDADVRTALELSTVPESMQPGQRNNARRIKTRLGTIYTYVKR